MTEHEHKYRVVYQTEGGRETVFQCECGNGYVYNAETDTTY